jgi:Cdc6-like AAA superfamily ATPase
VANELQLAGSLVEQTEALRAKTAELIAMAERSGDIRTALFAVREAGRLIELQARITGQLDRRDASEKHPIDARSQVVIILPDNHRDPVPGHMLAADAERLMLRP